MAKGVNKVMLLGRLGKDPEIKSTQGGMVIATFTLATSDRQKDQQGAWQDKTEWHNLVAFGRTAEIVRDYCKKGKEVFIEGKIQTRSWDDKESGKKNYRTEILVNDLSFTGGGDRAAGSDSGGGSSYQSSRPSAPAASSGGYDQRQPAATPDYGDNGITDDDIPF